MPRRKLEVPKSMEKAITELTATILLFLMATLFLVISSTPPAESYGQSQINEAQIALHMRSPDTLVTPFSPPDSTDVSFVERYRQGKIIPITQILNEYARYTHRGRVPEHFVYPENIGPYSFNEAIEVFLNIIGEYPNFETTVQPEDLQDPEALETLAALSAIQPGENVLDKVRLQLQIPYNETNTFGRWDRVYIIVIKNKGQEIVLVRADKIGIAENQVNLVHPGDTVFAFTTAFDANNQHPSTDPNTAAANIAYSLAQAYHIPGDNVWLYVTSSR